MDLIPSQEIEIRRLLQRDLQRQVHAVTQSSVTGLIIHVGQNDGVGGRKRNPVETPVKRRGGKKNQDRRSHCQPTSGQMNARTQFLQDEQ